MSVEFEVRRRDAGSTVWELDVSGDLDLAASAHLTELLDFALDQGAVVTVLHCNGVTFLDSSGLRALAQGVHRFEQFGGSLVIDGLSGAAQRVLELTGTIELLTGRIDPRAESALPR